MLIPMQIENTGSSTFRVEDARCYLTIAGRKDPGVVYVEAATYLFRSTEAARANRRSGTKQVKRTAGATAFFSGLRP